MLSIARKAYAVSVIINCKVARATYRAAEKIVEPYDEAGVFAPMFFGAQVGFDVAEGMARGVFHGDISITDFLVHGPRLAHERAIALMN